MFGAIAHFGKITNLFCLDLFPFLLSHLFLSGSSVLSLVGLRVACSRSHAVASIQPE